MKYIRTKFGEMFAVRKEYSFYGQKYYDIYHKDKYLPIREDYVIKQANTIEELCDEIVLKQYAENNTIMYIRYSVKNLELAKIDGKKFSPEKYEIYGAVWCEFGLKYVAKLNSKGELELL